MFNCPQALDHGYTSEYEQRNPNIGFYSDLYDRLMRPEPTQTEAFNSRSSSCLRYNHSSAFAIPHIVLGDTRVGGSWNNYDDNASFDFRNLRELDSYCEPRFRWKQSAYQLGWICLLIRYLIGSEDNHCWRVCLPESSENTCEPFFRCNLRQVLVFSVAYVKKLNLTENFKEYTTVTNITVDESLLRLI